MRWKDIKEILNGPIDVSSNALRVHRSSYLHEVRPRSSQGWTMLKNFERFLNQ